MRHKTTRSDTNNGKILIKNGKYFVEPGQDGDNFKKVFLRAVQAGVGRPVDPTGAPVGPWTAELLADAILQIDVNKSGVDLRTVQRWFEDNNRGIKRHNIAKLAKVFGCDDREATVAWQVELSVSLNRQLTNKLSLNTHRRKEKSAKISLKAGQVKLTNPRLQHKGRQASRTGQRLLSA